MIKVTCRFGQNGAVETTLYNRQPSTLLLKTITKQLVPSIKNYLSLNNCQNTLRKENVAKINNFRISAFVDILCGQLI